MYYQEIIIKDAVFKDLTFLQVLPMPFTDEGSGLGYQSFGKGR